MIVDLILPAVKSTSKYSTCCHLYLVWYKNKTLGDTVGIKLTDNSMLDQQANYCTTTGASMISMGVSTTWEKEDIY